MEKPSGSGIQIKSDCLIKNFMKNNILYGKLFFFAFLLVQGQSDAADRNSLYPTLIMHGETHNNTCLPSEKSGLMNALRRNKIPARKALTVTLGSILCADYNYKNAKRIFGILDNEIIESDEATGDQQSTLTRKKRKELVNHIMAQRNAWNANLDINGHEITLQYFLNEACVNSVSLRYTKRKWMIYRVGQACD